MSSKGGWLDLSSTGHRSPYSKSTMSEITAQSGEPPSCLQSSFSECLQSRLSSDVSSATPCQFGFSALRAICAPALNVLTRMRKVVCLPVPDASTSFLSVTSATTILERARVVRAVKMFAEDVRSVLWRPLFVNYAHSKPVAFRAQAPANHLLIDYSHTLLRQVCCLFCSARIMPALFLIACSLSIHFAAAPFRLQVCLV